MTCEFRQYVVGQDTPSVCLAPVFVLVRWKYIGHEEFEMGGLCVGHFVVGCEQLMADPEVIPASVEVTRPE